MITERRGRRGRFLRTCSACPQRLARSSDCWRARPGKAASPVGAGRCLTSICGAGPGLRTRPRPWARVRPGPDEAGPSCRRGRRPFGSPWRRKSGTPHSSTPGPPASRAAGLASGGSRGAPSTARARRNALTPFQAMLPWISSSCVHSAWTPSRARRAAPSAPRLSGPLGELRRQRLDRLGCARRAAPSDCPRSSASARGAGPSSVSTARSFSSIARARSTSLRRQRLDRLVPLGELHRQRLDRLVPLDELRRQRLDHLPRSSAWAFRRNVVMLVLLGPGLRGCSAPDSGPGSAPRPSSSRSRGYRDGRRPTGSGPFPRPRPRRATGASRSPPRPPPGRPGRDRG